MSHLNAIERPCTCDRIAKCIFIVLSGEHTRHHVSAASHACAARGTRTVFSDETFHTCGDESFHTCGEPLAGLVLLLFIPCTQTIEAKDRATAIVVCITSGFAERHRMAFSCLPESVEAANYVLPRLSITAKLNESTHLLRHSYFQCTCGKEVLKPARTEIGEGTKSRDW